MADESTSKLMGSEEGDDVRIDVRDEAEIERWSRRLGVPKDQFRIAAEHAGPWIRDIKQHLVGDFTSGPTS